MNIYHWVSFNVTDRSTQQLITWSCYSLIDQTKVYTMFYFIILPVERYSFQIAVAWLLLWLWVVSIRMESATKDRLEAEAEMELHTWQICAQRIVHLTFSHMQLRVSYLDSKGKKKRSLQTMHAKCAVSRACVMTVVSLLHRNNTHYISRSRNNLSIIITGFLWIFFKFPYHFLSSTEFLAPHAVCINQHNLNYLASWFCQRIARMP